MAIRNSHPAVFAPRGLYDSLDGENSPKGSCFKLVNLIHDVTTPDTWTPRPGAVSLTTFTGFTTPTFVSVAFTIGTKIFGLVSSGRNVGNDEPFCFDTATSSFVTISNVTASNTPSSPATSGAWVPPTMDNIGARIIVSHPGFNGAASGNYFGWFDFSGANITTITGNTHSSTTIDTLSSTTGLVVGYQVAGSGVQPNTFITAINVAGNSITISQATTTSVNGVALTFTGGTLAAPLWGAGNTSGNGLPSPALAVIAFNNRCYFACTNQAFFSDSSNPTNITNATQALTCGPTGSNITGFGTLPLLQTTGGILAGLIIFKAAGGYWQVTGDIALNNLVLNGPIGNIGCAAPRTINQTPAGLFFLAVDGVRGIDFSGVVSAAPLPGVRFPFDNITTPSRAEGAYNNTVYRVSLNCLTDPLAGAASSVDYWYDFELNEWSGPHTCAYDLCVPLGNTFVFSSAAQGAQLFQSDVNVFSTSVFTEFGNALTYLMQSSVLPSDDALAAKCVIEGTIALSSVAANNTVTVQLVDDQSAVLSQVTVSPIVRGSIWGAFLWGAAVWSGIAIGLKDYNLDWTAPVVFKKAAIAISGTSFSGLRIGNTWLTVEVLGYLNVLNPP